MENAGHLSSPRLAALAALTAAVYAIEVAVVHRLGARMPAPELSAAVAFDLAVVVPLAWWLVGLRGTPRAARRVVPVVVASLAGAALVVPAGGRALVSMLRVAVVPLEIATLVVTVRAVAGAVRAARSGADVAERLDEALTRTLGDNAASHLLAAEASAVFYAMGARRGGVARAGTAFTLQAARAPALTWGLVLATVVESVAVHALLGGAHRIAAWVMTALGGYAVLWLVGQDRAIAARTIAVEAEHLVLRAGLRLTARVPWSLVSGVETVSWTAPPPPAAGYLDVARPVEPNVVLRLRDPVTITAALGVRRRVRGIGLCVDDPQGLCAAIDARLSARSG